VRKELAQISLQARTLQPAIRQGKDNIGRPMKCFQLLQKGKNQAQFNASGIHPQEFFLNIFCG